jgi:hypothetical protein
MKNRIETLPLCFTGLLAVASALPAADSVPSDESALADRAKASVAAFADALKSELSSAMQAGGPLQAIEVCNTRAPAIAKHISLQQDMQVSRVSERNRNPGNAPSEWQATVLREFQARLAAGEIAESLDWHGVSETDSGREFRFMKAIPTGEVCLKCHGENIDPAVKAKLDELYPNDKARGYKLGDLRGAFTIRQAM